MRFHGLVALAGAVAEALHVNNTDVPAPIADQAGLLKDVRYDADARPLHPQHFRQEILRELNIIAVLQISTTQQPACQSCLKPMASVAGSRLLGLRQDELFMPRQRGPKRHTSLGELTENVRLQNGSGACDLNDGSVERGFVKNRLRRFLNGRGAITPALPQIRSRRPAIHRISATRLSFVREAVPRSPGQSVRSP